MPLKVSPDDYTLVELFVCEYGREPNSPLDGLAYYALKRGSSGNGSAQAPGPRHDWEPSTRSRWRPRVAVHSLARRARASRPNLLATKASSPPDAVPLHRRAPET